MQILLSEQKVNESHFSAAFAYNSFPKHCQVLDHKLSWYSTKPSADACALEKGSTKYLPLYLPLS